MKMAKFKDIDPSLKALNIIEGVFTENLGMKSSIVSNSEIGQCLILHDELCVIALTTCKVPHLKERVLKIEDIEIKEIARNQGLCTRLLNVMKLVCDKFNCTLGLWCKEPLIEFYEKRGFKVVDKRRDYWLEYKPSK